MSVHALMFGWEYPPVHSGGLGVACQGLVRGLTGSGVQVTLVLPHAKTPSEGNLTVLTPGEAFVELETILLTSALQPYDTDESYALRFNAWNIPSEEAELYGSNLGEAVERYTAASVEVTKHLKPDVVHCHDWMTMAAGVRAARYHNVPLITHVHATDFDRTDFRPNPWIAERERMGLLASDRIIAVSKYTKNLLVNHYGIPAEKISVVHNGHDQMQASIDQAEVLQSRHDAQQKPMVLFLGRLTVQKNPWQFLTVAKVVHDANPEVQFVMAGDGGMLPELIDRACELGLEDCVVFTGKVSGREAQALYERASCFVMPSLSEPFGLVALEAVANGAPVIVSKQSGAAEVLDHSFKIEPWDTDLMADCILTVLREEPLAMQLRTEARHILPHLSWRNQASKVHGIYRQLLS